MKIVMVIMLFCISWQGSCQYLKPGSIDFTGAGEFWKITTQLMRNETPKVTEWETMFKTPSYAYLARESGRETIIARLKNAFLPSRDSVRKAILGKNDYESMIIAHLIRAAGKRERLIVYADSLQKAELLKNALEKTRAYLPRQFVEDNSELYPPVAFALFEPDGKANDSLIVVDLAFAEQIDLNLFLAHEAHHFFMGNIRRGMKPAEENIEYVLKTIRQLHLEGIADLIDKRGILQMPDTLTEEDNWYAYHYRRYYVAAPGTLAKADSLIQAVRVKTNPGAGKEIWNSLHFGTHPEALHMALLIEETFGQEYIINILDNPFEFLRSYQKASIQSRGRGWVFSDSTYSYLNELEREYLLPAGAE